MRCRRSFAFGRRACLRLEPQRFNPAAEITRRKPLILSNGRLRPPVSCRRSCAFGRRACLRLEPQRFNPAAEITRRKPLMRSS